MRARLVLYWNSTITQVTKLIQYSTQSILVWQLVLDCDVYRKPIKDLTSKSASLFLSSLSCSLMVWGERFSIFDHIYYISIFSPGGGIPTQNMLIIFMNLSGSSSSIYTKDVSYLRTDKCAVFELRCKVQVCHATLRFLIWSFSKHIHL